MHGESSILLHLRLADLLRLGEALHVSLRFLICQGAEVFTAPANNKERSGNDGIAHSTVPFHAFQLRFLIAYQNRAVTQIDRLYVSMYGPLQGLQVIANLADKGWAVCLHIYDLQEVVRLVGLAPVKVNFLKADGVAEKCAFSVRTTSEGN